MRIMFDVGANWGTDSLSHVAEERDLICHAFEPTLELIQHLYKSSWKFADRYRIHPVALSDFDGKAKFNVSPHSDWGVSSLNEFSEGLDKTWAGRGDLFVGRTVEVDVWRLETLFRQGAIPVQEIDFFHCDVQGSDLKVLQGMGDFTCLIKEGCLEVPSSPELKLYKEQHTKDEALAFLAAKGFEVYDVKYQLNEENLYYRRAATRT